MAYSSPTRFDLRDAVNRNSVIAISEAQLEKTTGLSHYVSGWVELDPSNLASGIKGEVDLDIRTFYFGVELKGQQARELLGASEFPMAKAKVDTMKAKGKLIDGKPLALRLDAEITLRGVTKAASIPIEITYFKQTEVTKQRLQGNLLRLRSEANLDIAQFGVVISDAIKPFFNNKVKLLVDVIGSDQLPTQPIPLPEGVKPKTP
jgi:hypothetical protein